ncbi:MAG: hypothetical protein J5930_08165 [Treponema sp.]|nr:hypothetical protein [Treponema sp.]
MKTVSNLVQNKKEKFEISERSFLSPCAIVPFKHARNLSYTCIVKEYDRVTEGQIIGLTMDENTNEKSYIHSPVPGMVQSIEECFLPDGTKGACAKIRVEGAFSYLGKNLPPSEWQWYSASELLNTIAEKGVVNTFGSGEDLYRQIVRCNVSQGRFVIVRLFDDDPSHQTDTFVASHYTRQVLDGVHIVAQTLKAQGIIFAVPRKSSIEIPSDEFGTMPVFTLEVDVRRYPSGFRENLIHLIKKASKTPEQKIFDRVSRYSLFVDPETLYSVYEAVTFGKPVVETFVHVTGSCLASAAMLKVRVGSTIRSLVDQCGGFRSKPAKIIVNGMVQGSEVIDLDTAITKTVKSIAFVPKKQLCDQVGSTCIRCGKCRAICPEEIYPDLMYRHTLGGKQIGRDMLRTATLCSGCALCNSICPSRLPLCQIIAALRDKNEDN